MIEEESPSDQPEIWKRQLLRKIEECEKSGVAEIYLTQESLKATWPVETPGQINCEETFSRSRINVWLAYNNKSEWKLDSYRTEDGMYKLHKNS